MKKLNILVVHTSWAKKDRKTIHDSLYCFKKYVKNHRFFYLDVQSHEDLDAYLTRFPFDGVIFHYAFLGRRNNPLTWNPFYEKTKQVMANLQGYKVIIPQDEYNYTESLHHLINDCGIDHIFTCAMEHDYRKIYPPEIVGDVKLSTVFTGYVDEHSIKLIEKFSRHTPHRIIDIGYRARQLPYWVGQHGQLKTILADKFTESLKDFPDLRTDINTTGQNSDNVFLENSWLQFLLRCRTMLGCLGGSSLLDTDGEVVKLTNAYCAEHPEATFDEVEQICFPGQDGYIKLHALSPRHFECAMTKTCQILVEGNYFGVLEPNVHYIEIKKDFSNVKDVLEKIRDVEYCAQIAQKCYDDVVNPKGENKYTYAWFANHVIQPIEQWVACRENSRVIPTSPIYCRQTFPLAVTMQKQIRHTRCIPKKIHHRILRCINHLKYQGDALFYKTFNLIGAHPRLAAFVQKKSVRWILKKIFKEKIA